MELFAPNLIVKCRGVLGATNGSTMDSVGNTSQDVRKHKGAMNGQENEPFHNVSRVRGTDRTIKKKIVGGA